MRGLLLILIVVVATIANAAGSSAARRNSAHPWPPVDTAPAFLLGEFRDKLDGDWNAAWRTLYPLHRRIVSRIEFVGCERITPFAAPLKALHVVGVHRALVRVPGLAQPIPGVAIDVHVELRWYGPRDPIVFRHTFHLVPVHGHWTWLLSESRYRLYVTHRCAVPELSE